LCYFCGKEIALGIEDDDRARSRAGGDVPNRMSLLRAFIAIELPSTLQAAIHAHTATLRAALDASLVRWVPPHNIHVTLKFLGDISPSSVELLTQMLTREVGQYSAFEVQVGTLGAFPTGRRPRVIWVGLDAPPSLESLQHGIESAAARLGYGQEERGFSPHLTIGRVRQKLTAAALQRVRAILDRTRFGELGTARVGSVDLFRSELQPSGSVHTKLFSASLRPSVN